MLNVIPLLRPTVLALVLTIVGCQTCPSKPDAAKPSAAMPKVALPAIRIAAGATAPWTDPGGNVWLADKGFVGGDTVFRGNIAIAGTTMPQVYRSEHYGMTAFSWPVANGNYMVKLHFCETFDDEIKAKGLRVFDVTVEATVLEDLDVFAEAGGAKKALVKSVPVSVADGKLDITFKAVKQNSEINGIEIIPR